MVYRIKVISEEHGKKLCKENGLKLLKFYNGRGQFNKDKLMMEVELLDTSNNEYSYIYKRADGIYIGHNFSTPYKSNARIYNLTVKAAILKLIKLNEDNGPTWQLQVV